MFFAVLAQLFFISLPAAAAEQSVWQLLPYDVRVCVAFEQDPSIPPRLQAEVLAGLAERIEATVGASWNVTIEPAPPALRGELVRNIEGLPAERVPLPTPPPDKVLLLSVVRVPGGFEAKARDFDVRTNTFSSTVRRPAGLAGELNDAALDALLSAFAPLARIDATKGKEVVLRLKASGLPLRDPNLVFVREGDVFQPIQRFNDREGNLRRSAPVPWTFFTVQKTTPEQTVCEKHAGVTAALTRRGTRVEALALRVVPTGGSTVLTLVSRTDPNKLLSGYQVYSRVPGKQAATLLGRTDRQGQLLIPPGEYLLRVLLIKNGQEPLARVPMVPGLEPEVSAEIANDDLRLWAEGFIYSLQEELVDIVARRRIMETLIRARIEAGKLDQAEKMFEELRTMPTNESFSTRVIQEKEKFATSDHVVQKKIDRFLNDTITAIHKHLTPQTIVELERELREAKEAAKRAEIEEAKRLEEEKKAEQERIEREKAEKEKQAAEKKQDAAAGGEQK